MNFFFLNYLLSRMRENDMPNSFWGLFAAVTLGLTGTVGAMWAIVQVARWLGVGQ